MNIKSTKKLIVSRTLTTSSSVTVGVLAQNNQGIFFQYDQDYLNTFGNLSPFTLQSSTALQLAPKMPHSGLHGLFSDSLPDGWGRLLQDRVFRQNGILPTQVTALDRLAFVGERGMGALTFSPESSYQTATQNTIDLATLGLEAQAIFDRTINDSNTTQQNNQNENIFSALVAAGSSGGARPKAQLFFTPAVLPNASFASVQKKRTQSQTNDGAWLVKFTSQNLALGHEEGLCEAAYLHMAHIVNLKPPEWQLLEAPAKSGAKAWLAVKRFDYVSNQHSTHNNQAGRYHMHSACGLLDADFRAPSLDYEDLIKASRQLCKSPAVGQLQFRRAMFNLFASNQDDHSKNWAFLQSDNGQWNPAPFYDITFSPTPFNEHATAFGGYGKQPPLKTIQKLASTAGFTNWKQAQQHIHEIIDVLANFAETAKDHHVNNNTAKLIAKQLENIRQENKGLI